MSARPTAQHPRWQNRAAMLAAAMIPLLAAGCEPKPSQSLAKPPAPAALPPAAEPPAVNLQADLLKRNGLHGKLTLIQFGLIGCESSQRGLDQMTRLHNEQTIPGLGMIRVEQASDDQAVEAYYAGRAVPFPICRDSEAALAQAFDATLYPTYVLVDRFGRIRYRGPMPAWNRLSAWARTIAAEQADAGPDVPLLGVTALDVPKLLSSTVLPDLTGNAKPLGKYMGGRGLLVMFVDTSCPYSKAAVAELPQVLPALAGQGIGVVLVNLDEPPDKVAGHYSHQPPPGPLVYDATARTKNAWNVRGVPTLVLIDAGLKLTYNGKAIWQDLAAAAEKSLGLTAGSIKFEAKGSGFG